MSKTLEEIAEKIAGDWTSGDAGLAEDIASALSAERAEAERWRKLEREAAQHVEAVICMRSYRCDGEPPYVGWEGLGLALREDYDELDAARADIARLAAERDALQADVAAKWQPRQDELVAERDAARRDLAEAVEVLRPFALKFDSVERFPLHHDQVIFLETVSERQLGKLRAQDFDRARTLIDRMQSKEKVDG